jgi:hypothetical protein
VACDDWLQSEGSRKCAVKPCKDDAYIKSDGAANTQSDNMPYRVPHELVEQLEVKASVFTATPVVSKLIEK